MSEPLLVVEDVVKRYSILRKGLVTRRADWLQAVDNVSFELRSGETLGIVGESGCGKSTLARLLLRLEPPTSGRVLFHGQDVAEMGRAELRRFRSKVQIVFQDPYSSLNPTMTVGQLVTEPWQIHRTVPRRNRRGRAEELLEDVGVDPGYYDRRPAELSGGERQRIGIARALALSPDVVICDEPASALDVSVQAQILTLLQELQTRRGLSYVFISHDLSVVRYLAHRVAVMYLGRIVELGACGTLYQQPRHPYTRRLIDSARRLHGEAEGSELQPLLLGEAVDADYRLQGCRFAPRCPRAADICAEAQPPLRQFSPGQFAACLFPEPIETAQHDA